MSTAKATGTGIGASSTSKNTVLLPLPVTKLIPQSNSFAAANGLQIEKRHASPSDDDNKSIKPYYETAPISLLPNAFPRKSFEHAQSLAPLFNILVDRISLNKEFLENTLGDVASVDPFTGKLLEMYIQIYHNDESTGNIGKFAREADRLGILRSDYMLNCLEEAGEYELKQVELNTIASSFAGLSTKVANMHRYLLQRYGEDPAVKQWINSNAEIVRGTTSNNNNNDDDGAVGVGVPKNPALQNLPKAIQIAHERYKQKRHGTGTTTTKNLAVLFVVQEGETNTIDQRFLEFELWNTYETNVVRMSLQEINQKLVLDEETGGTLFDKDTNTEFSVVYFRAGYAPTDYPTDECWDARFKLERSCATKCPNLGYHLAGTKKVQQTLARPGSVEMFFQSQEGGGEADKLRSGFAGLFSLSSKDMVKEDYDTVKLILNEEGKEDQYVLKPQREGGGYNYYGEDLANKLKENVSITLQQDEDEEECSINISKKLAEFILMQRLFPPKQQAALMRSGVLEGQGDSISEFGCFGCILSSGNGDEDEIFHNEYAGFLLRTKFSDVNEGGVASGFATLSSPYLC